MQIGINKLIDYCQVLNFVAKMAVELTSLNPAGADSVDNEMVNGY